MYLHFTPDTQPNKRTHLIPTLHTRRPAARKANSTLPGGPSIFRHPVHSNTGHAATSSGGPGSAAAAGEHRTSGEGASAGRLQQEGVNKLLKHKGALAVSFDRGLWTQSTSFSHGQHIQSILH